VPVSHQAASKESQEYREIDYSRSKSFFLLRTVVPAVGNRGKRELATVQALSEAAKHKRKEGGSRAKQPIAIRTPGPKDMTRGVGQKGGLRAQGECECSSL